MMRLTAYAGSSVALATGVLLKALNQRVNFYSACVYLSQSNACVIVLVNLLVLVLGTLVFGLQRLLYGRLRPIETEQLYDRAWFAVTETCLAMTMFREEIGVWFFLLFVSLLVGKAWGWIGEGRVEILDQQPPANPRLFHARLSISLLLSLCFDLYLLDYSVTTVRHQARPTMMVMFAFEFAVLTAGSVSTALRYLISLREAAIIKKQTEEKIRGLREQRTREHQDAADNDEEASTAVDEEIDETEIDVPGWEDKGRWVFYLELMTDLVRLILYLTFFCVLCVFYGLPIYIIRDVAMAIRSFYKRINDFIKYKHATRDMNERYPDATAENIRESDVCIICREAMRPWEMDNEAAGTQPDQRLRPKKLPCGHILHFACLRSWLERQQSCPTCRQPVISAQPATGQANQQRQDAGVVAAHPQPVPADQGGQAALRPQQNRPRARGEGAPELQGQNGNGWRGIQLGPLRLQMGAWQEQAHRPGPPPVEAPQPGLQPPSNQPSQRNSIPQVGAMPPRLQRPVLGPATTEATTMQLQIDLMEQQVLQQINSLRVTVNHISRVRASQEELIRLHGLQHGGAPPSVQVFRSDPSRRPVQAGSEGLPPGLVLPDGWSLLPLNRSMGSSAQTTTATNLSPGPSSGDGRTGRIIDNSQAAAPRSSDGQSRRPSQQDQPREPDAESANSERGREPPHSRSIHSGTNEPREPTSNPGVLRPSRTWQASRSHSPPRGDREQSIINTDTLPRSDIASQTDGVDISRPAQENPPLGESGGEST